MKGWTCPVCGAGVSPSVEICPCKGKNSQVAWGNYWPGHVMYFCQLCGKYLMTGTSHMCTSANTAGTEINLTKNTG